jgi:hypothetical protein
LSSRTHAASTEPFASSASSIPPGVVRYNGQYIDSCDRTPTRICLLSGDSMIVWNPSVLWLP